MSKTFRIWWQRPEMHDPTIERKVSWLELFYDLVFVVAIAELAHTLVVHPDLKGILTFVFLFLPIWFSWTNGTYYHDLFETYDVSIRFFVLLQMLAVVGMAVFAHDAMGHTAVGFALSYAMHHLLMTYLWWRAGHHDANQPGHTATYTLPYIIPYGLSSILFVASVFVDAPMRFYLWGVGLALDFIAPILASLLMGRTYSFSQVTSGKMLERFGLFTLIVLGETIVGSARGIAAHEHITWIPLVAGLLGILIAFSIWWIYFDTTGNRTVKPGIWFHNLWQYLHFLMFMGIAATGAGVLSVIEQAGHELSDNVRWLLGISVGTSLIAMALLQIAFKTFPGVKPAEHRKDMFLKLGAGLVALFIAFFTKAIGALAMLGILWFMLALVAAYIFNVWLRLRQDGLIPARPHFEKHG